MIQNSSVDSLIWYRLGIVEHSCSKSVFYMSQETFSRLNVRTWKLKMLLLLTTFSLVGFWFLD